MSFLQKRGYEKVMGEDEKEQKEGELYKFATVSSYDSSDRSIATVAKHPTLAVNCIDCVAVQITCKKKGKTTLKATSSLGEKTSVPITVK